MFVRSAAHSSRPALCNLARIVSSGSCSLSSPAPTVAPQRVEPLMAWPCRSGARAFRAQSCSLVLNGGGTCEYYSRRGTRDSTSSQRRISSSRSAFLTRTHPHNMSSSGRRSLPHQRASPNRQQPAVGRPQVLCEAQNLKMAQIARTKKRSTGRATQRGKISNKTGNSSVASSRPRTQSGQSKPELNEQVRSLATTPSRCSVLNA